MKDQLRFFKEWANAPVKVAAIAPSSPALAQLITRDIGPHTGPVLELGPGTGVFTRALLAQGVPQDQLALIELNPRFAAQLVKDFPKAQVHCASATALTGMTLFPNGVGAVVSGLGLLNMRPAMVRDIVGGLLNHLRLGGALYQFTYGRKCPVPAAAMAEFDLKAELLGRIYRNLPPASVFRISR